MLDIVLSDTCLFLSEMWFRWFHGAPQGLLRRPGAVSAFRLSQLMALVRWQRFKDWLVLVAGVRLTEIFSDCTYLFFCSNIIWFACVALFVSPPANLAFAWIPPEDVGAGGER